MADKLTGALKSLPRERAGVGFTDRVLRRVEEPRRGRAASGPAWGRAWGPARWPVLAASAAVLLLAVALGAREWWHFHQRQQVTARLATLEEQRQALAAELAELHRQVAGARPVVYLGGSNDLDLVLDLGRAKRAGVRPEDIPRGLLQAYRLGLPRQAAALPPAERRSPGSPAYGLPAGHGAAGTGLLPVARPGLARPDRLDEARTRTIY